MGAGGWCGSSHLAGKLCNPRRPQLDGTVGAELITVQGGTWWKCLHNRVLNFLFLREGPLKKMLFTSSRVPTQNLSFSSVFHSIRAIKVILTFKKLKWFTEYISLSSVDKRSCFFIVSLMDLILKKGNVSYSNTPCYNARWEPGTRSWSWQ